MYKTKHEKVIETMKRNVSQSRDIEESFFEYNNMNIHVIMLRNKYFSADSEIYKNRHKVKEQLLKEAFGLSYALRMSIFDIMVIDFYDSDCEWASVTLQSSEHKTELTLSCFQMVNGKVCSSMLSGWKLSL